MTLIENFLHPSNLCFLSCNMGIIYPHLTGLFIIPIRLEWDNVHKMFSPRDMSFHVHPEQAPTQCRLTAAPVPVALARRLTEQSRVCVWKGTNHKAVSPVSFSPYLILHEAFFLTILPHVFVASQIKLYRKGNNPVERFVLFFSLDNLEEGKGILWLPGFPLSNLHFKLKHIYCNIIYISSFLC